MPPEGHLGQLYARHMEPMPIQCSSSMKLAHAIQNIYRFANAIDAGSGRLQAQSCSELGSRDRDLDLDHELNDAYDRVWA